MARQDIAELYTELISGEFAFVPRGIADLTMVYGLVQRAFPVLCDDDYLCNENCSSGHNMPEWQHCVRRALDRLKRQNSRVSKRAERSFWVFGPPHED